MSDKIFSFWQPSVCIIVECSFGIVLLFQNRAGSPYHQLSYTSALRSFDSQMNWFSFDSINQVHLFYHSAESKLSRIYSPIHIKSTHELIQMLFKS